MRSSTPTYQCSGSPAGRSLQGASQLILTMLIMPYSDPLYFSNGALSLAFAIPSTSLLPWNIVYSVLSSCPFNANSPRSVVCQRQPTWSENEYREGACEDRKPDSSFYITFTPSLLVFSVILLLFPNGILPLTKNIEIWSMELFHIHTNIHHHQAFAKVDHFSAFHKTVEYLSHWLQQKGTNHCKRL